MSDADIEALFYRLRWPPKGQPFCPRCGVGNAYMLSEYRHWRCSNSTCRKDFTLLSGTLLAGAKLPLRTYYLALDAFANRTTWKCGSQIQRAAQMNSKAGYLLSVKLHSLLADESERISTEELIRRALHAKPQPEHWNKFRKVKTLPWV